VRLLQCRRFDLVWLEAELFPGLPAWGEQLLARARVPYVVDYGDAVFHRYDRSRAATVRRVLGTKVDHVMRGAAAVIAGNDYLAARARQAGARVVVRIPSVVDLSRYSVLPPRDDARVTIGWMGSWSTARYLRQLRSVLEELSRDPGVRLVVVGAGAGRTNGLPVEARPWSEATEVAEIQAFDIGIMPLEDGPWERGKCGYKLIQYMACGKPAVASPVGVNRDIIQHGINGLHATSAEEWVRALGCLREDAGLRARMGAHGRKFAEERYSLQTSARILHNVLQSAAES
jgi:glycosyltransferase involved in cell wall biosynthesis